jgi:hypothetical protein
LRAVEPKRFHTRCRAGGNQEQYQEDQTTKAVYGRI